MPDVLRGALDPCVAPRRILLSHPNDEAPDLGEHTTATGLGLHVRPLPGDESAVPQEHGVSSIPSSELLRSNEVASTVGDLVADQPLNLLPEYWRWSSLSRFPLVDDGLAGSADLLS